jgi:ATP-binding cassette subfamily C protein
LDAIQQIRASNREKHYYHLIRQSAREVRNHARLFAWKSDAATRFSFGIFLFGFDVFRAVTMLMVVFSDLSIGEMMAVFGYLWFMMSPVQEVLNIQYAYYAANAALARINDLFSLEEEPQYPHISNPFQGQHTVSVEVRDLVFQYPDQEREGRQEPVLNGVSLHIHAGEKVALVGASGGGKSTLVQVILGMYPIQQGQLLFNGVPVTRIGLDVVRENVATVLQHPALFNDTLRVNLTLGKEIPDSRLLQALEVAQLHDTVQALPHGLDSIIGRAGVRLSGGQRQRLAIARMILTDPKVVILDEATSALDSETEGKLHRALHDFLEQRTTLIVAHRLSAVKQADRVLVFDDGRIIEEGEHDHLIQAQGLYARLYKH